MKITKAVITAAGRKQRTLPLQMLIDRDGAEKSVLSILIEEVLQANIEDICLVVRPGDETAYAGVAGDHTGRLHFVRQPEPLGYGHALYCAKAFVGQDPFLHLVGDHLYGYADPGWGCQDFSTGESVWNDRKLGKGAIGYADGMLYCLEETSGTVALIEASPKGWTEHGRFKLEPQTKIRSARGKIWTHPVISNGKLYLRDQELFFAFDVKKK